ncbi:ABC transporter substrate-binding protein [Heliobacterium gestii]|uniref:ABC transporter substrate-binding protein n=1 Tax=Heliomicrobium gestii TaxID=2699 RepID=A0A845LFM1_HELGE|nr:ABC transporter substrate-binding protein [Heliomicrobium gestii]MBM7868111.1 iron complex transport system substrate-binding protein [Heliomicrobium gestii]MZP44361.1 ABC transporter substrate-binding protein [Heliomicrobium gestii]
MEMVSKLWRTLTLSALVAALAITAGCGASGGKEGPAKTAPGAAAKTSANGAITVVDDAKRTIQLAQPARRIISLYSGHTENLFSLGLNDAIIGVSESETYPPEVKNKAAFDYRADAEKVIAAKPDLVLIRTTVFERNRDFVDKLEQVGIPVVALFPENLDDFYRNMDILGTLTGRQAEAETCKGEMKQRLADFDAIARSIPENQRKRVFLEATKDPVKTVTSDSMAALVLQKAGAINVAADAKAVKEGSSIASYGDERLLTKAGEIDVYLAQKGVMNRVTEQEIYQRPGFEAIKAIKEKQVYLIDGDMISRPTMRLLKGIEELGQRLYPDYYSNIKGK